MDAPASSSFSSLTLFECTIGNATMLVESMSSKDLVSAWRISGQLQNKIVEVLDPRLIELTQVAELHTKCAEQQQQQFVEVASPAAKLPRIAALATAEDDSFVIKKEEADPEEESDDCMILEEMRMQDLSSCSQSLAAAQYDQCSNSNVNSSASCNRDALLFDQHAAAAVAEAAFVDSHELEEAADNKGRSARRRHVRQQQEQLTQQHQQLQLSAAAAGDAYNDARNVMRLAYKQLKADGPHLFDFSQPFSSSVNQVVASRVVDLARSLPQCRNWDDFTWKRTGKQAIKARFLRLSRENSCHYKNLQSRRNRIDRKLNRRQRSFESLMQMSQMSAELMDQYRTILSREFTSSDEEAADEALLEDSVGAAAGNALDEEPQQLRIRDLVWQSEEVRRLKTQLDQLYLSRFASAKQQSSLAKCVRDVTLRSKRSKPNNCPAWACV